MRRVRQHVRHKLGGLAPTTKEVLTILKSLPNLERGAERDSFVVPLKALGYTDRCEVVLRARGAPMHLRDLNSAIGAESSKRVLRTIGVLLSASSRFVPVGRTGYWALQEWQDVESRTIADMAAELLESSPEPLHRIELYRVINVRRRIDYH